MQRSGLGAHITHCGLSHEIRIHPPNRPTPARSCQMSRGQTIRLIGDAQRQLAHRLIDLAPAGAVVNIAEEKRTLDQSAKMWAMLSDISRAKPDGRKLQPDIWKSLFMASIGHKVRFEPDLDGEGVVAIGYSTSRLNKAQMSNLIEAIYAYGAQHNVQWSEPRDRYQDINP